MAVKTITIDTDAYDRLKGVQKANESFSQTIKRVVRKPVDADGVINAARKLSPKALDAHRTTGSQSRLPQREGLRDRDHGRP